MMICCWPIILTLHKVLEATDIPCSEWSWFSMKYEKVIRKLGALFAHNPPQSQLSYNFRRVFGDVQLQFGRVIVTFFNRGRNIDMKHLSTTTHWRLWSSRNSRFLREIERQRRPRLGLLVNKVMLTFFWVSVIRIDYLTKSNGEYDLNFLNISNEDSKKKLQHVARKRCSLSKIMQECTSV